MSGPDIDAVKARQREIWAAGDPDTIAGFIRPAAEAVVETAQIEPGMDVLDVGTGTGSAALAAARAGAHVVGLDLTPELLDAARRHAAEDDLTVEWLEGDAEALPFGDASFDRVLSSFGVMFAPRQKVAAAELARVCRPGGSVVLASWTPDGFQGRLLDVVARHLPPPPAGASSPPLWGDERHVRTLLGGQLLLAQERRAVDLRPPSADLMIALYNQAFGPFIAAREALGDAAFAAVEDDARALIAEFDVGEDVPHIRAEYLLTIAHRP